MLHSMTGFGKAVTETPGRKITVEIRSLNSKQLDLNLKVPWIFKEVELEMRKILGQELLRGKIDVNVYLEVLEEENPPLINSSVVTHYHKQLREIAGDLGLDRDADYLSMIMRLPEVLRTEKPELKEEDWKELQSILQEALDAIQLFRKQEGESLERDLRHSLEEIKTLSAEIVPLLEQRIQHIRERIGGNLTEYLSQDNVDPNRLEQEIIFYIEKLDVNEELVRLENHCAYFLETLEYPSSQGKKLGFIAQEIGREINTLGSKANDALIQKKVIRMKEQLEKIKEQVLNVL